VIEREQREWRVKKEEGGGGRVEFGRGQVDEAFKKTLH